MPPVSRLLVMAGLLLVLLAGCKRSAGQTGQPPASGWLLDAEAYYASPHGELKCSECHLEELTGDENYPHGPIELGRKFELDENVCARCHPVAFRENGRGAHAKAAEEEQRALDRGLEPASLTGSISRAPHCNDCHTIHRRLAPGEE